MLSLFLISKLPQGKIVKIVVSVYNVDSETISASTAEELYKKQPTIRSFEFLLKGNSFFIGNNKYDAIVFGRNPLISENEFPVILDEGHVSRTQGRIFSRVNRLLYEDLSRYGSAVGETLFKKETYELQNNDIIRMGVVLSKKGWFYAANVQVLL